jgi:hypothetical protein
MTVTRKLAAILAADVAGPWARLAQTGMTLARSERLAFVE